MPSVAEDRSNHGVLGLSRRPESCSAALHLGFAPSWVCQGGPVRRDSCGSGFWDVMGGTFVPVQWS